jgi:hypothetical protein
MTDENIKSRTLIETNKPHRNLEEKYTIELIEYTDGSIAFSDPDSEEGFIYLYPEQLEQLSEKLKQKCNGKNCPYYDGK